MLVFESAAKLAECARRVKGLNGARVVEDNTPASVLNPAGVFHVISHAQPGARGYVLLRSNAFISGGKPRL